MQNKEDGKMRCEICHYEIGHSPACPYYQPPKVSHYCCICGSGIYPGESYVTNGIKYIHDFCLESIDLESLMSMLGYQFKIMDDEELFYDD